MTYTGPALTRPQLDALRSIERRGDTMEVHPAREGALQQRGLIICRPFNAAELTDDGRDVLAQAARVERAPAGISECGRCAKDRCACGGAR